MQDRIQHCSDNQPRGERNAKLKFQFREQQIAYFKIIFHSQVVQRSAKSGVPLVLAVFRLFIIIIIIMNHKVPVANETAFLL